MVSRREAEQQEAELTPSPRSLRGLDGLNFLLADVRDGLGPYLAVFLKGEQHWPSGAIGIAMAASSIAAAVCQIPAGLLVDGLRFKRLLVAVSGLLVAAGCLLIAFHPKLAAVVAAQVMLGAASAIIPPALAALSLGLVGHRRLDARISRNESFNHGGNFVAAGMAGTLGYSLWVTTGSSIWSVSSRSRAPRSSISSIPPRSTMNWRVAAKIAMRTDGSGRRWRSANFSMAGIW